MVSKAGTVVSHTPQGARGLVLSELQNANMCCDLIFIPQSHPDNAESHRSHPELGDRAALTVDKEQVKWLIPPGEL